ncbi:MAG: hypothetical protein BZY88_05240 [SAR202 cluster bacterium Io17-Chloro-G9]|nr:MAG: hypothetical protein BZY88_05240 [SAR202 cluster bacterium Io17-Chloro-G9]
MDLLWLYIYSYLVGAVPTAYIIAKLVKGVDLRRFGSGNVGGSNLYQVAGGAWLVPLGLFEVLVKGGSPIWIGRHALGLDQSPELLMVAPLLAVAGNNWPVFLRFHGGRGVAVGLGTLLVLAPSVLGAFIALGLIGWALTRNSGLWVLISLALLPLWSYLSGGPLALVWYTAAMTGMVVLKRLVTNDLSFPQGVSLGGLLLNRLLLDRDSSDQEAWVQRAPESSN